MDAKAEEIALFHYGLIAPLVLETLPRGELTRRAEEIAARSYDIPYSQRHSLSVDTLLDWALRYRRGGFAALAKQPRHDRGQSRALTPQLAELIERLKRENPHRTGATLLRELALVSTVGTVSPATLYRFLKQRGLTARQLLAPAARKKFETEFSNQIWQSDLLFGPYVQRVGTGPMEAFLYAILDDASRLIPHAEFYAQQGLDVFLDCSRQAVAARGLPLRLYVDNLKAYRSSQLARIAASMGILITHTPLCQPQERAKTERYFCSVLMSSPGHIRPRWTNPVLWRRPASERGSDQQTLQMDEKSGTIALFRFGLIAPMVLERSLPARELTRRAREIAARDYDIPYSKRTSVSVDTLLHWVLRYREGGFEALVRKPRSDRKQFRTIAPLTVDLIERLKRENPNLTGTALLHELRLSSGHDSSGMSAATLYRFLKQRGLSARQLTADAPLKRLKRDWRIDFISDEDRGLLTEWRRSKDKNLWQKAVTVLENSNLSPEDIARKVERPLSCIRQWIKAFKCGGIKALNPARKPRLIAADLRATLDQKRRWILEILHTSPRFYAINRSNWNLRSIVLAYRQQHNEAISTSTVGRFVKKSGYTMKKARKVLCSPDPEYREKVDLVLHTLQNLEPLDLFFFVDELGPMQVKKYGGRTFVPKNKPYTFPQQQKSRGVINVAGALNAVTNQVTWLYGGSKDTTAMIDLIELLFNQYMHFTKIYIAWDAASWHRSNVLVEWLDTFNTETLRCGNGPVIYLVPLPTSSQFLDVIEAVFSGMKKAVIHHSNYQSEQEMKAAVSQHFVERNTYFLANPKRAGQKIWELDFFTDYDNLRYGDYREW